MICCLWIRRYEDQGDTIALQYGGSHLVNRIQTYRKSSRWTAHSKDILNTVSRYYSNSFTDADKQDAINVFLGKYLPDPDELELWSLDSDKFLHFPELKTGPTHRPHYFNWCSGLGHVHGVEDVLRHQAPSSNPFLSPGKAPGDAAVAPLRPDEAVAVVPTARPALQYRYHEITGDNKQDYISIRRAVVEKVKLGFTAFDDEVKQLAKQKWRIDKPSPADFVTAAILTAAHHGIIFSKALRMPPPLAEPTLKEKGGFGEQIRRFYASHLLIDMRNLYHFHINSTTRYVRAR